MIGPTLFLVAVTLVLVAAGIVVVMLRWQPPHQREDRLFVESRDGDATLQLAPALRGASPAWMRVNLRDGLALLALAEGEDGEDYAVFRVPAEHDPRSPPPADALRWRLSRRPLDGGLEEAVAIKGADGTRLGSATPEEARRLGLPVAWSVHLPGRRYRVAGREVLLGEEVAARLFPGPYPRLSPLQLGHLAAADPVREEAVLLVMFLRWNELLIRKAALRRQT